MQFLPTSAENVKICKSCEKFAKDAKIVDVERIVKKCDLSQN